MDSAEKGIEFVLTFYSKGDGFGNFAQVRDVVKLGGWWGEYDRGIGEGMGEEQTRAMTVRRMGRRKEWVQGNQGNQEVKRKGGK